MTEDKENEIIDEEHPKWLVDSTIHELASQMLAYFLKISKGENYIISDPVLFWSDKGYHRLSASDEKIIEKVSEVERIVEEKVQQIMEERRNKQEQEENVKLPQIIADCIVWMKENGFGKKLTRKYLNLFLSSKNLRLMEITVERLYAKGNEELKKS